MALGCAGSFASADDLVVVIAHANDDYGLLDEALAEARAAIPSLLAALAA